MLHIDASGAILMPDAVLPQEYRNNVQKAISYASLNLTDIEQSYHSSVLECSTLVWSVQKFRPHFYGHYFVIVTDNGYRPALTPKLARWAILLQEYNFSIIHRSGQKQQNTDFLSRHLVQDTVAPLDSDACFYALTMGLQSAQQ